MAPLARKNAPAAGFWRVGRVPDPLHTAPAAAEDMALPNAGNRFDGPGFACRYFATELEGCFAETLARFRPPAALQALVRRDWERSGYMLVGSIPADWRSRRAAVRASPRERYSFLNVDHPDTHQLLSVELSEQLAALGVDVLDRGVVAGRDRRITRAIAAWAYEATSPVGEGLYAGIRYLSRLGPYECWAVFDDCPLTVHEARPLTADMVPLVEIARRYQLTVH